MSLVYLGIGIAVWVALKAWEWYEERGRYEIQAIRRTRRRASANTRRFPLPLGRRRKGMGTSSNDEHGSAYGRVDLIRFAPGKTALRATRDSPPSAAAPRQSRSRREEPRTSAKSADRFSGPHPAYGCNSINRRAAARSPGPLSAALPRAISKRFCASRRPAHFGHAVAQGEQTRSGDYA